MHAGDEQLAGVDLALDLAGQIARDLFHSNQSNEPRRLVVVSRAGRHGAEHMLENGGGGLGLQWQVSNRGELERAVWSNRAYATRGVYGCNWRGLGWLWSSTTPTMATAGVTRKGVFIHGQNGQLRGAGDEEGAHREPVEEGNGLGEGLVRPESSGDLGGWRKTTTAIAGDAVAPGFSSSA